jgi:hypothetical protein
VGWNGGQEACRCSLSRSRRGLLRFAEAYAHVRHWLPLNGMLRRLTFLRPAASNTFILHTGADCKEPWAKKGNSSALLLPPLSLLKVATPRKGLALQ